MDDRIILLLGSYLIFLFGCQSTPALEQPFLYILGTAQDAGYPQVSCTKSCCTLVKNGERAPEMVTSVAIMDPSSGQAWLLDASPDFTAQVAMIEEEGCQLAGVFLTHAHIGHYTGLMYLGREAMGAKQMPVYCHSSMAKFLSQNGPWSQLVTLDNINLHSIEPDSTIALTDSISIRAFLVPHRAEFSQTFGFWVEGPNAKAIYLPDIDKWRHWNRPIDSVVQAVNYALLDATFFDGDELPNRNMAEIPHPFVVESLATFAELSAGDRAKIYFTHLNHTNPLLQLGSEATIEVKKEGYHIARTGMRLPL